MTPGGALELAKAEHDWAYKDAMAKADMIKAQRTGLSVSGGGTSTEKLTALTGYANSLNSQIANLDKALSTMDPKDSQAAAYRTQRDRAYTSLQNVRSQIEGARLGLGGEPTPAPAPDVLIETFKALPKDDPRRAALLEKAPWLKDVVGGATAAAKPALGGKPQANPNASYMERHENWKRYNERYEHFKKQGKNDQAEYFRKLRDENK
jgi:outer membrane murein-binding lipoprotein Lpp